MYDRRSKAERTDDLTDKKELRRRLKARAAALPAEYRKTADASIRETVLASALWREAESVFLYVSMWAEPDTYSLLSAALRDGKRVYVPLCCPDAVMQAVRIRRLDELRPGTLNIPEPVDVSETAAPGEIDLAIVPCLAAAKDGRRSGHGALPLPRGPAHGRDPHGRARRLDGLCRDGKGAVPRAACCSMIRPLRISLKHKMPRANSYCIRICPGFFRVF